MDQEVVKTILKHKGELWRNPVLYELVQEFFANTLATLNICAEVEECIQKARDKQMLLRNALDLISNCSSSGGAYIGGEKIHELLRGFRFGGSPFGERFLTRFQDVHTLHCNFLTKMQARKKTLDQRWKSIRVSSKVSSIMLGALIASIVICSMVATAIIAPPIVGTLVASISVPLGSMGHWAKSLGHGYHKLDVSHQMDKYTFIAINDLHTIESLVLKLESLIESLSFNVEFSENHPDMIALHVVVHNIANNMKGFVQDLDALQNHIAHCTRLIEQARIIVLQNLTRHHD